MISQRRTRYKPIVTYLVYEIKCKFGNDQKNVDLS